MADSQHIVIPGFSFSGLHCGIKDQPQKKDLALIYSSAPHTTIAGVFTKNKVRAAPVVLCQKNLQGGNGRLVVINSGVANAATGAQGIKDAKAVLNAAAKRFGLPKSQIFICSTGKIGERLPLVKLIAGIKIGAEQMSEEAFADAAEAIRTTDAYAKTAFHEGRFGKTRFRIGVMAKGAGMICPDMATMLGFVLTDLKIGQRVLQTLLGQAVDETLNCLTVDGDTSTNDTVLALAGGSAGNAEIRKGSPQFNKLQKIFVDLLRQITLAIALDGEGATKCFEVRVTGAKTAAEAKAVAAAVGNSQLVKTAMFGCDPNWGRILCAIGYSGAEVDPDRVTIHIGKDCLYRRGKPINQNQERTEAYLRANRLVDVCIDLGLDVGQAKIFSSDLTVDYVKLNADYRT